YLLGARDAARLDESVKFDTFAGERKLNPTVLRRWMKELEARAKLPATVFTPWFELAKLPESEFATNAVPVLKSLRPSDKATQLLVEALIAKSPQSLKEAAAVYTEQFKQVDADWKALLAEAAKENQPVPTALPSAERETLRQGLYAEGSPVNLPRDEAESILA